MTLLEHEQDDPGSESLAAFCRDRGIRSLAVFGSRSRGDAGPESDLDLLVEFEPGRRVTLLDMARIEMEMTTMLGRTVDLRTAEELSPYFRQEVVAEAQTIYAQK